MIKLGRLQVASLPLQQGCQKREIVRARRSRSERSLQRLDGRSAVATIDLHARERHCETRLSKIDFQALAQNVLCVGDSVRLHEQTEKRLTRTDVVWSMSQSGDETLLRFGEAPLVEHI